MRGFIAKATPLALFRIYSHYVYAGLMTLWTKYLIVVLPVIIVIAIMIINELKGDVDEE